MRITISTFRSGKILITSSSTTTTTTTAAATPTVQISPSVCLFRWVRSQVVCTFTPCSRAWSALSVAPRVTAHGNRTGLLSPHAPLSEWTAPRSTCAKNHCGEVGFVGLSSKSRGHGRCCGKGGCGESDPRIRPRIAVDFDTNPCCPSTLSLPLESVCSSIIPLQDTSFHAQCPCTRKVPPFESEILVTTSWN